MHVSSFETGGLYPASCAVEDVASVERLQEDVLNEFILAKIPVLAEELCGRSSSSQWSITICVKSLS
jgi:hypothetical protein